MTDQNQNEIQPEEEMFDASIDPIFGGSTKKKANTKSTVAPAPRKKMPTHAEIEERVRNLGQGPGVLVIKQTEDEKKLAREELQVRLAQKPVKTFPQMHVETFLSKTMGPVQVMEQKETTFVENTNFVAPHVQIAEVQPTKVQMQNSADDIVTSRVIYVKKEGTRNISVIALNLK